jgi:hypothetical protein
MNLSLIKVPSVYLLEKDNLERSSTRMSNMQALTRPIKLAVLSCCVLASLSDLWGLSRSPLFRLSNDDGELNKGGIHQAKTSPAVKETVKIDSVSKQDAANNEDVAEIAQPQTPIHADEGGETKNIWDDSAIIPPWMKRYFAWHKSERSRLSRENWESTRYLVLRCLPDDDECGGASDRLGPLPYLLMLANQTNRLLLIHWSRPTPLEEFLVPPVGGMDWRVPDVVNFTLTGVRDHMQLSRNNVSHIVLEPGNSHSAASNRVVVEARFRGFWGSVFGAFPPTEYDKGRESPAEATFEQVYSDMWHVLFEPSPPVKAIIQSNLEQLGLNTHEYLSAHIRAQYVRNATGDTEHVKNALHCAAAMRPDAPIYLASDSTDVIRFGVDYGRQVLNRTVVALVREDPPLHIDRGRAFLAHQVFDWNFPAREFYDTFVDLYLLSYGVCTAYGIGNYGHWARVISRGSSCYIRHSDRICPGPSGVA